MTSIEVERARDRGAPILRSGGQLVHTAPYGADIRLLDQSYHPWVAVVVQRNSAPYYVKEDGTTAETTDGC